MNNLPLSLDNVDIDKIDTMSVEFLNEVDLVNRSSRASEIHLRTLCLKHNLTEHETNWALLWYSETIKKAFNPST